MRWMKLGVLAFLLATSAHAGAPDPLAGLIREPLRIPVTLDGRAITLEALALRPAQPGRHPLVVMIHGTPRDPTARPGVSPAQFNTAAVAFARRGYATVAVMRRGFGQSDGPYAEGYNGPCEAQYYLPIVRTSAEDVLAATAQLRTQPWADPDRVILLGQSTGGVAVSAADAAGVPGLRAVLDFAGGRGSTGPDTVCNKGGLIDAFAHLGATARIPALWLFSENDHFFNPDLARRMHDAYRDAGAPGALVILPPFGKDGHELITNAPEEAWWPSVEPFLHTLGLPTQVTVNLPDLPHLPPPAKLSNVCHTGYEAFLAARTPARAYATAPSGGCGWVTRARTPAEASDTALKNCTEYNTACRLYAVGTSLVGE